MNWGLLGLVVVAVLAGCSDYSQAGPDDDFTLPCKAQPDGALCITVNNDHLNVKSVTGWLEAVGSHPIGKTWRLVLTIGGQAFPGLTHHRHNPMMQMCEPMTTAYPCNVRYSEDWDRSFGFLTPTVIRSAAEFCISKQVQTAGRWHTVTTPTRVCSLVS